MSTGTHTGGARQGRQTAESSRLCPAAATRAVRRLRRAVRGRHRRRPGTRKEMRAPRGGTGACTRSPTRSRARLLPASSVEDAHEVLEALALEIEDAPAQRRQLVVPTTGIVELRRRAVARFDDQTRLDEPFQRAIQ